MDFYGAALSDGVHALVGLALDVDAIDRDADEFGDACAHGFFVRSDPGAFEHDCGIEIGDDPAGRGGATRGLTQVDRGVLARVARIGIGEELADVGHRQGSEDGICDGVEEGVSVGVGDGDPVGLDLDAAEHQPVSGAGLAEGFQAVQVVPMTDPNPNMGSERTWVGRRGFRHLYESTDNRCVALSSRPAVPDDS